MYYHIQILHKHNADEFKINLSEEELLTRIIKPYQAGIPIVINGRTIELELIKRIKIFETTETLDVKIQEFEIKYDKDPSPYKMFGASPAWTAIETGKNVTDKFITGPAGEKKGIKIEEIKDSMKIGDSILESSIERIFVVHGHDNGLKDETCVFLSNIGLEPIVLHRQPDGGLTIIEKFEKYSDVKYVIVLLTPDDYGFKADELKKSENERKGSFRARQNVIFELGFFIGKLGRRSVCYLFKDIDLPSDISGLIYKKVNKTVEEIGYEIIKELKNAGLQPKI